MILSRHGKENLRLAITTDPVLSGWEVSFDDGATWTAGTLEGGVYHWLIAGPDAAPEGAAFVLPVGQHRYLVRATDTTEVIVREDLEPGVVSVR